MNQILHWLSEGDLRTDGLANEVVRIIQQQPQLIADLMEGLEHPDASLRGHTADALEKIGRSHPELLLPFLPQLLTSAQQDPVAIVKMHMAMIFGHLAMYEEYREVLTSTLMVLIQDKSVFAACWAIVGLCIFARKYPADNDHIIQTIAKLQQNSSVAIRTKVNNAIILLTNDKTPFPEGWIKSNHLKYLAG